MSSAFHGITSLVLTAVAIIIATVTAVQTWWVLGALYLVICAMCLTAILLALCAKCPCKAHCGHVIPGRLAALKGREPGPCSGLETTLVVVALLLLLGLPQLWLWRYVALAAAFWACMAVAVVEIRTVVCRACDNAFCPMKAGG